MNTLGFPELLKQKEIKENARKQRRIKKHWHHLTRLVFEYAWHGLVLEGVRDILELCLNEG